MRQAAGAERGVLTGRILFRQRREVHCRKSPPTVAPSDPRRRSIAIRAPRVTTGRSSCPTADTFSSTRSVLSQNIRVSTWRRWTPPKQRASSPAQALALYGSGYLLFVRDGILFAQAFDDRALQTRSEAVRIADGVGYFSAALGYIGRHRVTGRCARLRPERGDDHRPAVARSRRGRRQAPLSRRRCIVRHGSLPIRSASWSRSGSPKPGRATSGCSNWPCAMHSARHSIC